MHRINRLYRARQSGYVIYYKRVIRINDKKSYRIMQRQQNRLKHVELIAVEKRKIYRIKGNAGRQKHGCYDPVKSLNILFLTYQRFAYDDKAYNKQ